MSFYKILHDINNLITDKLANITLIRSSLMIHMKRKKSAGTQQ